MFNSFHFLNIPLAKLYFQKQYYYIIHNNGK